MMRSCKLTMIYVMRTKELMPLPIKSPVANYKKALSAAMTSWKSYTAKDYVGDKKDVRQLGKPRRNCSAYLLLRKSDERRFSQAGGRISQCLAAEHRLIKGCKSTWSATSG